MVEKSKKLKVAIVFGGKSVEHEISLQSAKNVIEAIDKNKYDVSLISIDKNGSWHFQNRDNFLVNQTSSKLISLNKNIENVNNQDLSILTTEKNNNKIDVVFPILHGSLGEDGTMQGFLKLAGLPFVGPSVLGSAVGFDKDVTKRLLTQAGIPNTKFIAIKKNEKVSLKQLKNLGLLSFPVIIKPANSGSSIGMSKVNNEKELIVAMKEAFKFDSKILIEEFIENKREIECAVLGNENPKASVCGEIITNLKYKFYSYEAKYLDENGAKLEIPAKISKTLEKKIQEMALGTFEVLGLEGMSRIDFFLTEKGKILVNEVNTIPGFTNISMYPKLWEASGVSYKKLIDQLIKLAIERFKREQKLKTSYDK